jgi:uncharacterized protein with HEPN domain
MILKNIGIYWQRFFQNLIQNQFIQEEISKLKKDFQAKYDYLKLEKIFLLAGIVIYDYDNVYIRIWPILRKEENRSFGLYQS